MQRPEAEIDLATAALLVGAGEYPELDVAGYLEILDGYAQQGRSLSEVGPHRELRALNRLLFDHLGFRGDQETYYDPRNGFLNEVIDRRLGIPITLSVLYMEVGRRMGLSLGGLNFPGHFLVRYDSPDGMLVIDPFHLGMVVPLADLQSRLKRVAGHEVELSGEHLQPAGKRQIVSRILRNLLLIYQRNGDAYRAIAMLERMLSVEPDDRRLQQELAKLRRRAEEIN